MRRKRGLWLGMIIAVGVVVGVVVWPLGKIRQQEQDRRSLFRAIQHDDTETVRALLESGVDANMHQRSETPTGLVEFLSTALHWKSPSPHNPGPSALMEAIQWQSYPEIVRLLLTHGARVNVEEEGDTPLLAAMAVSSSQPDLDVVRLLLEHGADPNARPPASGGHGALMYALSYERRNIDVGLLTKMLLDHGADPTQTAPDGRSYMTSEVWEDHLKTVAAMLDHGANINANDQDRRGVPGGPGTTPLATAISAGHIDMLKMLLARGARIEPKDGEGLISDAVYKRDDSFLKALLARGVSIDSKTWQGMTPLMNFAYGVDTQADPQSRSVSMKMLLAHGANLEARNNDGQTPLIAACWYAKDLPQVKFLLARGADPNAFDKQGTSALEYAAMEETGGGATVAYLLAHGANARHTANGGYTALMSMAINKGDTKSVTALVAAGCDPNARNKKGNTALMLARLHKNKAMIQALRLAGAVH